MFHTSIQHIYYTCTQKILVCVILLVFSCAKKWVSFLACEIRYIQYLLYVLYKIFDTYWQIIKHNCPLVFIGKTNCYNYIFGKIIFKKTTCVDGSIDNPVTFFSSSHAIRFMVKSYPSWCVWRSISVQAFPVIQ